ncbi:PilZ domain-containing protein [Cellulomonas sp. URHE0023]|uniref:PilZ domain-containing protein n=1 Tax=Cellulomonas sp. URHE0023 TaxID=1380354 RepID=UPI0005534E5F|nr:PilZ domain-containing protein [Cellulomonas sp. URHE0023]
MHDLAHCTLEAGDRELAGYVVTCADGNLTFAAERGVMGTFRTGDDVQALVLDDVRGEVRYAGYVSQVGVTTVRIQGLELTSMLQKRKVARVNIAQLCTGVAVSPDGTTRDISFVVVDISAHGMRISTTTELTDDERVVFEFPATDRIVPLDAEVLRVQHTGNKLIQYGCRFVDLAEKDMDVLFRFVLQTQGSHRRNRLG